MKLEFDSVEDLGKFLHWADNYRSEGTDDGRTVDFQTLTDPLGARHIDGTPAQIFADKGGSAAGDAAVGVHGFDTPPETRMSPPVSGDSSGAALQPAEPVNAEGKPTRKRRTKAEIEAAAKAEASADEAAALAAAVPQDKQPEADDGAKGANPFEQAASTESAAPADQASDAASADDDEAIVTPFQHLTRAREFIAKHGMPKYNETFSKAGLDPNVMAYTGYQRALHKAAMDEADRA